MGDTSIEWTDKVWNPTRGCSRVSPGCDNCYAIRWARRMDHPSGAYDGLTRIGSRGIDWSGRVVLAPDKLDEPLRWRTPQRIFVGSMSDLFHESLPDEAIDRVFAAMAMCDGKHSGRAGHTFQVPTKRPERMARYFSDPETPWRIYSEVVRVNVGYRPGIRPADERGYRGLDTGQWPLPLPNVWLGVSCEDQPSADKRIVELLATPAAKRFVSYEPALGPVNLRRLPQETWEFDALTGGKWGAYGITVPAHGGLDWVIVGGESGPRRRPMEISWIESIADQCSAAGVPLFVKQDNGPRSGMQGRIPDRLWARKEFPA